MRWFGVIGFSTDQVETDRENRPGVFENSIEERKYYGEMTKRVRQWIGSNKINDDITISNTLVVYADPYLTTHFGSILYISYLSQKWKVESADYYYPKITLQIGGLYNEQTS